jgi:hypothetical protein
MTRTIEATPTWHNGVKFRSLTEARWSAFLVAIGVSYEYEPGPFDLSEGGGYLPDFWIPKFNAFLQVKPDSAAIKHLERHKAEQFCLDRPKERHLFGLGYPRAGADYVEEITTSKRRGLIGSIREDAKDEGVFWLANDSRQMGLGGWGKPSLHNVAPIETKRIRAAYLAANCIGRLAA